MRSTCREPPWRARADHSIRASPCTDMLQGSPFYIHVNWIEMLMQASSTTKLGSNIFRPSFLTTFWLHNIWKYNLYYKSKSFACHRTPWDLCRQAHWAPDIRMFAYKWYVWKRGLINGTYLEKRPYGYKCYLYMERPCGGYKRYKWEEDLINGRYMLEEEMDVTNGTYMERRPYGGWSDVWAAAMASSPLVARTWATTKLLIK